MALVAIHLLPQTEKIYLPSSKVATWHALILTEKSYGRRIYLVMEKILCTGTLAHLQFYPASI